MKKFKWIGLLVVALFVVKITRTQLPALIPEQFQPEQRFPITCYLYMGEEDVLAHNIAPSAIYTFKERKGTVIKYEYKESVLGTWRDPVATITRTISFDTVELIGSLEEVNDINGQPKTSEILLANRKEGGYRIWFTYPGTVPLEGRLIARTW